MIRLTKDKIIYITDHYNPEYEKYEEKEVLILNPYLNEVVELSSDFTFEDLFKIIEREKDVFDVVFTSHLGHFPLQLWIDEIRNPGPTEDDEIAYLEIHRYGESWGKEDENIELFLDFGGVGKKEEDPSYGVGFTALNKLKHLPLRLNEEFEISEIKIPPRIVMYLVRLLKKIGIPLGKWDNPFQRVHVKGKAKISVYELISAILYEISFYGDPTGRDVQLSEIEERVEDAMEQYEEFDSED